MCIMGLFYGKAMWSFIMRPEFTSNYCLGEFSWTAIFLSFLASWLFEISMDHRKNSPQKQESAGFLGQEYFNGTMP